MIDNNIVQALGVGSGIDTRNLVNQLVEIERAAPQARIDSVRKLSETRISDFGQLSSALSNLRDAAAVLGEPEALFSKTASFTESTALVPLELSTDVQPGSYAFSVSQVAQSHTLAFGGFASDTDAVGEGTLTFSFGSFSRDSGDDSINGAFTQDAEKDTFSVTIDATNNSLTGIRDAINSADAGVSASIVFDGSDYNLSIVSASGGQNELQIVADEGGAAGDNVDGVGLSQLAFNDGKTGFEAADAQSGKNAKLSLNGIAIEREQNTIDDIVDGLKLDVLKVTDVNETVTITVAEDKAFAEQSVRDMVDSYNTFLETIEPIFGIKETETEEGDIRKEVGSLANDSLAKSLLNQIRSVIASSIPGLADSNFSSLTNLGIRTELDGTISINETDFNNAFENNFDDVQKLLAPRTFSSSEDVSVSSFNDSTTSGQYDLIVSQTPSSGVYQGDVVATGYPLDTTGKDYTLEVTVNGTASNTLVLPEAVYASADDIAIAIQSLINTDENIEAAGASVTVSASGGAFAITSNSLGGSSNVSVTAAGADAIADGGFVVAAGTAGSTAAGTINGVEAFGSANVLLPALGQPGEGLALIIGAGASSATVNFSRGFAGELERLIDSFLQSGGVIATRTETLNDSLDGFEEDESRLERRIEAYEQRLINQFIATERIVASLKTSGSFLDNLIDTLPFTAKKD